MSEPGAPPERRAIPRPASSRDGDSAGAARHFAQSYAEARDKFFAAARSCGLGVESHVHPLPGRDGEMLAMDVARDGADGREVAARRQQRLPRRRGLLRLGRAGRAAARSRAWHEAAHDAGVAVLYIHGLNPYGFSWWRRTTHENVDLNRNFRDFAAPPPANDRYDELAAALVPADLAGRRGERRCARSLRRRARRARAAAGDLGRPVPPSGRPLLRRQRADLEPRDAAPGAAPARQPLPAAGLDRPAHRPRPERPRRAHLRLPRRRRRPTPARRRGGATSRRSTTARRPRRC